MKGLCVVLGLGLAAVVSAQTDATTPAATTTGTDPKYADDYSSKYVAPGGNGWGKNRDGTEWIKLWQALTKGDQKDNGDGLLLQKVDASFEIKLKASRSAGTDTELALQDGTKAADITGNSGTTEALIDTALDAVYQAVIAVNVPLPSNRYIQPNDCPGATGVAGSVKGLSFDSTSDTLKVCFLIVHLSNGQKSYVESKVIDSASSALQSSFIDALKTALSDKQLVDATKDDTKAVVSVDEVGGTSTAGTVGSMLGAGVEGCGGDSLGNDAKSTKLVGTTQYPGTKCSSISTTDCEAAGCVKYTKAPSGIGDQMPYRSDTGSAYPGQSNGNLHPPVYDTKFGLRRDYRAVERVYMGLGSDGSADHSYPLQSFGGRGGGSKSTAAKAAAKSKSSAAKAAAAKATAAKAAAAKAKLSAAKAAAAKAQSKAKAAKAKLAATKLKMAQAKKAAAKLMAAKKKSRMLIRASA